MTGAILARGGEEVPPQNLKSERFLDGIEFAVARLLSFSNIQKETPMRIAILLLSSLLLTSTALANARLKEEIREIELGSCLVLPKATTITLEDGYVFPFGEENLKKVLLQSQGDFEEERDAGDCDWFRTNFRENGFSLWAKCGVSGNIPFRYLKRTEFLVIIPQEYGKPPLERQITKTQTLEESLSVSRSFHFYVGEVDRVIVSQNYRNQLHFVEGETLDTLMAQVRIMATEASKAALDALNLELRKKHAALEIEECRQ